MSKRLSHLLVAGAMLVASALPVAANEFSIVRNGEPLGDATVSVETLGGDTLASARTGSRGTATCAIPREAAGQPLVYKVTDRNGTITEHFLTQPADKPFHLVAMDTEGGIIGYSEETYGRLKAAMEPLRVGKNSEVGSGARVKAKAKQAVGRLGGGAFGGGGKSAFKLGGGGGATRGMQLASPTPKGDRNVETHDDPIADADKRIVTDPATGTKLAVGSKFVPEGLLVSTTILQAPGQGTFQSMSLMDKNGNMAGPTRYNIFQTYMDWWLYVYWWRTTYLNGQVVSHEEGGWSDEGRVLGDKYSQPVGTDGAWNQLGFGNAVGGIQSLGGVFPIGPDKFYGPMTLVVHTTQPEEDPVITTPFAIGLARPAPQVPENFQMMLIRRMVEGFAAYMKGKQEARARMQKLINEIDELGSKIQDKKKELEKAQTKRKKYEGWGREYNKAMTLGDESDYVEYVTGKKFKSPEKLGKAIEESQNEVARLTTELKDLQNAQNDLKKQLTGEYQPVVDMLQPIVVIA